MTASGLLAWRCSIYHSPFSITKSAGQGCSEIGPKQATAMRYSRSLQISSKDRMSVCSRLDRAGLSAILSNENSNAPLRLIHRELPRTPSYVVEEPRLDALHLSDVGDGGRRREQLDAPGQSGIHPNPRLRIPIPRPASTDHRDPTFTPVPNRSACGHPPNSQTRPPPPSR